MNYLFSIGEVVYNKINGEKGCVIWQRSTFYTEGNISNDYYVTWGDRYMWEDEGILTKEKIVI